MDEPGTQDIAAAFAHYEPFGIVTITSDRHVRGSQSGVMEVGALPGYRPWRSRITDSLTRSNGVRRPHAAQAAEAGRAVRHMYVRADPRTANSTDSHVQARTAPLQAAARGICAGLIASRRCEIHGRGCSCPVLPPLPHLP